MALKIQCFTFNGFQENSYVISDQNGTGIIIDPGCYSIEEENELVAYLSDNHIIPVALLNTHAHIDHVLGNSFVKDNYKIPLYLHKDDTGTLDSVRQYASLYGFEGYKTSPSADIELRHGMNLVFGEMKIRVLHTPGHAPGHVIFYFEEDGFVINGDVLFNGSFGRVDLPGGNIEILKQSIFEHLFTLPEVTIVYCGHGPSTTIGKEKRDNFIHQF
jgi:glyoxylase-like metal-dependent hydrolase (beta-lactamase superfamily II)